MRIKNKIIISTVLMNISSSKCVCLPQFVKMESPKLEQTIKPRSYCNSYLYYGRLIYNSQLWITEMENINSKKVPDECSSPQSLVVRETEEGGLVSDTLVKKEEPEILKTQRDDSGVLRKHVDMVKTALKLLNNLPEVGPGLVHTQDDKEMQDNCKPLHLRGYDNDEISLGIKLLPSKEGFVACQVEDNSVLNDKLKVGDEIIKVNGQEMAGKKMEDVLTLFRSMATTGIDIVIKCRRVVEKDCVDGANTEEDATISFDMECMIRPTIRNAVEMAVRGLNVLDKYTLLQDTRQPPQQMCIFSKQFDETTESMKQYFFRCDSTMSVAGQSNSILVVHHFINCNKANARQVWILEYNNKFITASCNKQDIELKDGNIGKVIEGDGRAFIYSKYADTPDSIMLESLQYPKHYLGIDGCELKLLCLDDGDRSTTTALKCQLEVINVR